MDTVKMISRTLAEAIVVRLHTMEHSVYTPGPAFSGGFEMGDEKY